MPANNNFRHQEYRRELPDVPITQLVAPQPIATDSAEYRQRMQRVGDAYRAAGVFTIFLVHGTFVGRDALGWFSEIARVWPAAAELLREQQKKVLDAVLRDAGNYTAAFAQAFEAAINVEGQPRISVRVVHWSGENHHLGRADGAIRLLAEIFSCVEKSATENPHGRILLWGHSHAGNVFALATNLLASDQAHRQRFFEAASSYYRWPLLNYVDVAIWPQVQRLLDELPRTSPPNVLPNRLDFVTFGTPIRYGWDAHGYGKLLHVIAHQPAKGVPSHLAKFPPLIDDVRCARGGDFIQQLGIAGTNFLPNLLSWRDILADQRLNALLQPQCPPNELLARLSIGARVPDEGETLLVDYGPMPGSLHDHVAGHAVYTRIEWLLFHAEQVAARFYAS